MRFWILFLLAFNASAQTFPDHPVKLVVPFAPGAATDTMGRAVALKLSEMWGQPVVVENRPGAATGIGAQYVAKSAPDGYTLLLAANETLAINPFLFRNLGYDPAKDFALVRGVFAGHHVLLVHPSLPAKNAQELVAYMKANPGKVSYASTGNGATTHLNMELFKSVAGVSATHVPYKGAAPAMTDLLGGRVQLMLINMAVSMPHLKAGKLNTVGIAAAQRSAVMPDLPTIAEQGYPGFESNAWFGLVAPAGTPRPVVDKISRDTLAVVTSPEIKDKTFAAQGLDAFPLGPDEFAAQVKRDADKFSRLIRQAGITPD